MKVLVTGHDGYIGAVLVPMLRDAGHEVTGLDCFLFEGCAFGERSALTVEIAQAAGIHNSAHLKGGLDVWKKAGGAVEEVERGS